MEGLKKPLSRALSLALMMAMAFFGMLAITQAVYADEEDFSLSFSNTYGEPGDVPLFSDGNLAYDCNAVWPDEEGYSIELFLEYEKDAVESDDKWTALPDGCYSFEAAEPDVGKTGTLTLKGPEIWNAVKDQESHQILLTGFIQKANEEEEHAKVWHTIDVEEPYFTVYGDEDPEWEMLPREDEAKSLGAADALRIYNSQYPTGQPVEITSVDSTDESVITVEEITDGWECIPKAVGDAVITLNNTYPIPVCVRNDFYSVYAESQTGPYTFLPGATLQLAAEGDHRPYMEDEEFTYKWSVKQGDTTGTTVKADQKDSSKATVTAGRLGEDEDESRVIVAVSMFSNAVESTDPVAEATCELWIKRDYYEVHPLSVDVDEDIPLGESITIKPEMWYFSADYPSGKNVTGSATFETEDVDDCVTVVKENGAFKITRVGLDEGNYGIRGTVTRDAKEESETEWYWVSEIPEDLDEYYITFTNAVMSGDDEPIYLVETGGTITPKVQVSCGGYVLKEGDDYSLKYEKETGYDETANESTWEDAPLPLGEGLYRVTAVATEGGVYTGETDYDFGIYDKYNLAGGCWYEFADYDDSEWFNYYALYTIPAGLPLSPTVTMGSTTLKEGRDYSVEYWKVNRVDFTGGDFEDPEHAVPEFSKEIVSGVPTEPGLYACNIVGISPYYGQYSAVRFELTDNPDGKNRAQRVIDMINALNLSSPNANAVKAARTAYNNLPEKAFVSAATLKKLTDAEKKVADAAAAAAAAAKAKAAAKAAEDARQGIYDPTIPKVKAKKPAAKKAKITAKWTKLKKKQLKKSKATNYEIWVCPNTGFAKGDTIERIVGKGKASIKIGGLQKNTKYFVKVRAIKYVNGKKYVGPWNQKSVKTKKK